MYDEKILKQERKEIIKKNLFMFALTNLLFVSSMKIIGLGLPYYKDSQKTYSVSITNINNHNHKTTIEKYLNNKDLTSLEKENKIYVADNYKYEDKAFTRNVKVYILNEKENYEEILKNYKKYINQKQLIDEYHEETNRPNNNDAEISIEYYTINKDKYKPEYESNLKNNISSILYSIVLALTTGIATYDSIDNIKSINYSINKAKKLKKEQ
ncbi:MAG: hypothetical protein VZS44_01230 [Bacilli bacterium]|nr:hypothetical protein [Bacilli bacterium]